MKGLLFSVALSFAGLVAIFAQTVFAAPIDILPRLVMYALFPMAVVLSFIFIVVNHLFSHSVEGADAFKTAGHLPTLDEGERDKEAA